MSNEYVFKDHPRTCAPDDFWGQVKRTVNGRPVGEDQIQMIVDAVTAGLDLHHEDVLLDLCCGNGALSTRLFALCQGGTGADFSAPLIQVAHLNFQAPPREMYFLSDVVEFLGQCAEPARFTKALCYGAFQYLAPERARVFLETLYLRFPNVQRIFIGNLPDKDRMEQFFRGNAWRPGIENDPGSPIGIWRAEQEFSVLSVDCGWRAEYRRMPAEFYAAGYRYDAILFRG